ncbi:MAG: Sua5/YciO/YrdC/YwlC family protein, partial [Candidatus Moraniibacteriota bacterium]
MNTIAMSHTTDPTKQSHTAEAIRSLCEGGVVVLPTDTVYGIVANALIPEAVEKVFQLHRRDMQKAVIILISDTQELTQFSVHPDESTRAFLASVWPGKVSVILPTTDPA